MDYVSSSGRMFLSLLFGLFCILWLYLCIVLIPPLRTMYAKVIAFQVNYKDLEDRAARVFSSFNFPACPSGRRFIQRCLPYICMFEIYGLMNYISGLKTELRLPPLAFYTLTCNTENMVVVTISLTIGPESR